MKTTMLMAMLLLLSACGGLAGNANKAAPVGVSVKGVKVGVDYDGKDVTIGEGTLKENIAVVTFFGMN
ncbi:MAG: hypothetical protein ACYTDT_14000 [Planctomycetota bacterium]|jgi:hypothetical protein